MFLQPSHILKIKSIEINIFDKRKKKKKNKKTTTKGNKKTNFPKQRLGYHLSALVFRVLEHVDLKRKETLEGSALFSRDALKTIANKQTQFLYQGIAHGSIDIHHLVSRTILPIKTRKKTTKSNLFLFIIILDSIIIYCCVCHA